MYSFKNPIANHAFFTDEHFMRPFARRISCWCRAWAAVDVHNLDEFVHGAVVSMSKLDASVVYDLQHSLSNSLQYKQCILLKQFILHYALPVFGRSFEKHHPVYVQSREDQATVQHRCSQLHEENNGQYNFVL